MYLIILNILFCFSLNFPTTQSFELSFTDVFAEIITNIPDLTLLPNPNFNDDYDKIVQSKLRRQEISPFEKMQMEIDSPRVSVKEFGTARGRVMRSFSDREFYAFQSIPYANPPVDEKRFKMSEEFTGQWPTLNDEDEFDASYIRAKCPQASMFVSIPGGREDCLHISIYTPNTMSNSSNYPVMYFIHGGSFYSGEASLYVPTKLMDEDVVVVVVQYRLGSLGFLSSGTVDAPGNMGLMDQVLGLKWIKKYIRNFGGDPDNVTVMGQSAGGASASWMQMTPQTRPENNDGKPLFHQLITMSGSALEMWTLDPDPEKSFIHQADLVECYYENDTQASLDCMMGKSPEELVIGFLTLVSDDRAAGELGFFGNCPIVQDSPELQDNPDLIVIPEHPLRTIHNGDALNVNVMAGSVRDEGSLVLGILYLEFLSLYGLQDDEFFMEVEAVPYIVNSFGIVDLTGAAANSMYLVYFSNAEMGNFTSMSGGMVDMSGMLFLKTGLWSLSHLLDIYNPNNSIYFYSFEFESDDSIFDWIFLCCPDIPIKGGITHTDDLLYVFYLPSTQNARERQMSKRMTTLLTNFAKYGDPTPDDVPVEDSWQDVSEKWIPFKADDPNFMLISDNLTMEKDYKTRWNYNTIPDEPEMMQSDVSAMKSTNIEGSSENGLIIATAILGTTTGCLIIISLLLFVLRK